MKSEKKNVLAAAGVIVSLMIGAGFASGRELMTFFGHQGARGLAGLVLACALLSLCCWAVMDISVRMRVKGYGAFMSVVLGKRFGQVMTAVVNVFVFVMMSAMFSGFGAALKETTGMSYSLGVAAVAVLCFVTLLFDLRGIIRVSAVLAPVLVVGGLLFALYSTAAGAVPVFLDNSGVVKPAAVYASYNIITAVPVLVALGSTLTERRQTKKTSALSGAVIMVLGIAFLIPMLINLPFLKNFDLPLLALARLDGALVYSVYVIVLFAAIFTTAVSDGFAVIEWLSSSYLVKKHKIPRLAVKIAVPAGGAALAHIGFNAFVDKAYPLFGFIGLFEIAAILLYALFGKKE